jgi:hypothetical protein
MKVWVLGLYDCDDESEVKHVTVDEEQAKNWADKAQVGVYPQPFAEQFEVEGLVTQKGQ